MMQNPYGAAPYILPNGWAPYDPYREERRGLRRTVSRLAFCALAAFPLSQIIGVVLSLVLAAAGSDLFLLTEDTALYYLLTGLLSYLTVFLPFLIFLLASHRPLTEAIRTEHTPFLTGILLVFAGLFVCFIMNVPVNFLADLAESAGLNGEINTDSMTVSSIPDLVTLILAVVLIAPVVEEFCYRGVVVSALRRWGDLTAALVSALLFAMAHFSFLALPVVFVGGFVMAYLYVRTGNLWVNIAIHFLNNLFATLPIMLGYFFGESIVGPANDAVVLAVLVLGICSLAFLLLRFAVRRVSPFPNPIESGVRVSAKIGQIFANPGMICYLLLFVLLSVLSLVGVF